MNPESSSWHTPIPIPPTMDQSVVWSSPSASMAFEIPSSLAEANMDDSLISVGSDEPEPSSKLKANGHLGFVRYHRDALKQDLAAARQSSSSFRRLAFRLAAQIAARDARSNRTEQRLAETRLSEYLQSRTDENMIMRLTRTISTYEGQGRALLDQLKNWGYGTDISGK
jgi:hypothetical protein